MTQSVIQPLHHHHQQSVADFPRKFEVHPREMTIHVPPPLSSANPGKNVLNSAIIVVVPQVTPISYHLMCTTTTNNQFTSFNVP
jgi:hypothetical protein